MSALRILAIGFFLRILVISHFYSFAFADEIEYLAADDVRVDAIKKQILKNLGYEKEPEPVEMDPEEYAKLREFYQRKVEEEQKLYEERELMEQAEKELSGKYEKKLHVFTDTGLRPNGVEKEVWEETRFFFNVNLADYENIISARLNVYKAAIRGVKKHKKQLFRKLTLNLYQISQMSVTGEDPARIKLDSISVSLLNNGWESFNVKRAVEQWVANNSTNHGLELTCEDELLCSHLYIINGYQKTHNKLLNALLSEEFRPSLNVVTEEVTPPSVARVKRAAKKLKRKKKSKKIERTSKNCKYLNKKGKTKLSKRCCRQDMVVNFEKIGFHWIVAPSEINLHVCKGKCKKKRSGELHKPAGLHAMIQLIMHEKDPKKVPRPCCTAIKYKPLTLFHWDNQKTISSAEQSDMIVEDCACS